MSRKNYNSFNRGENPNFKRRSIDMIEVYLEELARACEEIQESKGYPDNNRAVWLRGEKHAHAIEMIEKIKEWVDDNVDEDERS